MRLGATYARSLARRNQTRSGAFLPEVTEGQSVEDQIEFVPDEVLEDLALEAGPASIPARVLRELWYARARDRQVFAFRVGDYWITGPLMDAKTEAALIDLAVEDGDDED